MWESSFDVQRRNMDEQAIAIQGVASITSRNEVSLLMATPTYQITWSTYHYNCCLELYTITILSRLWVEVYMDIDFDTSVYSSMITFSGYIYSFHFT